nr:MAG TPA: hypothetical protein [Bacteriophage sp.]
MIVEPSLIQGLAADCPFSKCLGFDHALSTYFFLLSRPFRLGIFHPSVLVYVALELSSNSIGYFTNTLR